jgi:hypothetical protein
LHENGERSAFRDLISQKDWGLIFEELMSRDLIDLPLKYTHEQNFFNDTQELEQIFIRQEESNLFCIHRLQEAEENLEYEYKKYKHLKDTKEKEEEFLQRRQVIVMQDIKNEQHEFEKQKKSN